MQIVMERLESTFEPKLAAADAKQRERASEVRQSRRPVALTESCSAASLGRQSPA